MTRHGMCELFVSCFWDSYVKTTYEVPGTVPGTIPGIVVLPGTCTSTGTRYRTGTTTKKDHHGRVW